MTFKVPQLLFHGVEPPAHLDAFFAARLITIAFGVATGFLL